MVVRKKVTQSRRDTFICLAVEADGSTTELRIVQMINYCLRREIPGKADTPIQRSRYDIRTAIIDVIEDSDFDTRFPKGTVLRQFFDALVDAYHV